MNIPRAEGAAGTKERLPTVYARALGNTQSRAQIGTGEVKGTFFVGPGFKSKLSFFADQLCNLLRVT